jgi:hypothetical protein
MFRDVPVHSGCILNRRPYGGMPLECVGVTSELILCQDPIILPLTEILTVPVSQTDIEPHHVPIAITGSC